MQLGHFAGDFARLISIFKNETRGDMRLDNPVWGKQQRIEEGTLGGSQEDEDLGSWVFMQRWM